MVLIPNPGEVTLFRPDAAEAPMSYELTITRKPMYLHAVITGVNNRENVEHYLEDIRNECISRHCFRVLIEERLEGPRLGTMDVFQIASEGSARVPGNFEAIAYVDVNAEGDLMKFAETVATNRFVPVKVFDTVSEAERWLLGDDHGSARERAPEHAGKPPR